MEYRRTKTRLQLLKNGFDPLPNKRKMCLLKGWSKIDITEDLISSRDWERLGKFRDTGVRCGKVVAIDLDIEDNELMSKFLNAVQHQGIIQESPFVRIGKPPKEMWIYRAEEKIGKSITGKFGREGDKDGHQVEVLGHGCQFGAYGKHSDLYEYDWPELDLREHHISELPVITREQVRKLIEFSIYFFELQKLTRITRGGDAVDGFNVLRDLESHHAYLTDSMGELSVDELENYLRSMPQDFSMRLRSSPFRPGESNLKSVLANITHDELCISDFYLGTSQFRSDTDMINAIHEIGDALRPLIKERREKVVAIDAAAAEFRSLDIYPEDDWETMLAKCLKRYVFVACTNKIGDMVKLGRPDWELSMEGFKNLLYPYRQEYIGPRKTLVVERLEHTWRQSPQRMAVNAVAMRPDMPGPIFLDEDGVSTLNTYRKPVFPISGGCAAMGLDFIRRLIPDPIECHWFMTWLASKYQNPAMRGHGVVMVADKTYGTGRGTLLKLLGRLFGKHLVCSVNYETFSGKNYQSQYTDWVADNLFIGVEETHEVRPGENSWTLGNNAYEHLKDIIDPGKESMLVNRKVASNTRSLLFSSILLFTNHSDALVIPYNDRRLTVLSNGEPQSEEYWARFNLWMENPSNLGAFAQVLIEWDISSYNPYGMPLQTEARDAMIEGTRSDLDEAISEILENSPADVLVFEQVRTALEIELSDSDMDFPDNWMKIARKIFDRNTKRVTKKQRIRIAGIQTRPRIVRNSAKWAAQSSKILTVEALKAGDPAAQVAGNRSELNNVIQLNRELKAKRDHE